MVIKQLEEGKFLFWCPACNDNHVIDKDYTLQGDPDFPTISPSYYDWDDKGVCHVKIAQGKLYFLPDCTHELAEQTVPMCPIPGWMLSADYEEPISVPVDPFENYYYPESDQDDEEWQGDVTADDLADKMLGIKSGKVRGRAA